MNQRVSQAVILAAGNGSRLVSRDSIPKPLVEVAGRTLLDHILTNLEGAGIQRAWVVVGYRGAQIRSHCSPSRQRVELEWAENPSYHLPNGMSLLSVRERIDSPFLLLMSDHLFEPATLESFLEEEIPARGGILATDSKIEEAFDLEDATKVRSNRHRIVEIGKQLPRYDCLDTGMFLLTPAIFEAMETSVREGEMSLSGGISVLTRLGAMRTWDIGAGRWIDVDTPQALAAAERLIEQGWSSPEPREVTRASYSSM